MPTVRTPRAATVARWAAKWPFKRVSVLVMPRNEVIIHVERSKVCPTRSKRTLKYIASLANSTIRRNLVLTDVFFFSCQHFPSNHILFLTGSLT